VKTNGSNGDRKPASADARRRSLLDLAPLELDCMNTLWPIGEGTVREIRERLAPRLPRAYTTIMTIMDRLTRKGIVERRKLGRAYIYRPALSAEEARAHALGQIVEGFFGGSREAAAAYLRDDSTTGGVAPENARPALAAAAAAGASTAHVRGAVASSNSVLPPESLTVEGPPAATNTKMPVEGVAPIDATLL
jgi:BlaI family transcriptional regulator, penicillinase repressor